MVVEAEEDQEGGGWDGEGGGKQQAQPEQVMKDFEEPQIDSVAQGCGRQILQCLSEGFPVTAWQGPEAV